MDARVSAAFDSFEASVRAAFREALAPVCHELSLLRRDLAVAVGGVSDPAPMISDDAESIDLGHPGLQGDNSPPRNPSPMETRKSKNGIYPSENVQPNKKNSTML
ncbi:hypothetical protein DVH24_024295 [Malus domestica]|uniref:Uncharacterized protein n=1 Tax=Malus domestica TaxID=3750 RepID=A0A498JMR1_MALDO|nr:hypothetical protein DVH24_024295 [Malus domestica]